MKIAFYRVSRTKIKFRIVDTLCTMISTNQMIMIIMTNKSIVTENTAALSDLGRKFAKVAVNAA